MRVAIVGSREWADEEAVRRLVRRLPPGTEVVSGGARGVDTFAAQEAVRCGLPVKVFPADWERHGKKAGYLRNVDIITYAEKVVAFWDGVSKGTGHDIDIAHDQDKPTLIIYPDKHMEKR